MQQEKNKKNVTLKDIAKEVGVSSMAVSKALNGTGSISPEITEKIKRVAKKMNYTPNYMARSLKTNQTKTIGVVAADSSQAFLANVIRGIEAQAREEGYSIILCNSLLERENEKESIRVLLGKRVDGLILAASMLTDAADMEYIRSLGVPVMFLVRRNESDGCNFVINDNFQGSYDMMKYLIESGSKNFHFINLNPYAPSGKDRQRGYESALLDSGLAFSAENVYHVRPDVDEAKACMARILDEGEKVETVFCGCDVIGIGVMEAVLDRGFKIPADVRVAAYDDIDFAAYLRVPLTTVSQPKYSMGRKGARLLIDLIQNKRKGLVQIVLKSELKIRQST